jgi:hypothetical protein
MSSYAHEWLCRALSAPKGLKITLPSAADAIKVRQDLYSARKADRKANTRLGYSFDDPRYGTSQFDCLRISIQRSAPNVILITFQSEPPSQNISVEELQV